MNRRTLRAAAFSAAFFAPIPLALAEGGEAVEAPEALIHPDYWSDGKPRAFVSSRLEAGLVYGKPQIAVGYGRPYWMWIGAEAYAISTNSFGAAYAGFRAVLPFANLSLGARDTYSYYRSFLLPKNHYVAEDVSSPTGDRQRYLTLEAELSAVLPVPGGYFLAAPTFYVVSDVPKDRYVYEESLRGVMKPPFIWAVRLAYVAAFGQNDEIKAGGLFELVELPGRNEHILRAGPAASVSITDHLDVIGAFSMVLSSPDSLGIWHGPFGQLGLRYYFATGEEKPRFP
jgi:hypothetical protein